MEELVIRGDLGGVGKRRRGDDDDDPRKNRKKALEEDAANLRKERQRKKAQVRKRYAELLLAVNGIHDIAMTLLEMEFTRKEIEDANLRARD